MIGRLGRRVRQTHQGAFVAVVPVVFAERGVTADPFAGKLVDPLRSKQLKVKSLLKLPRQISVEPNPQGDLAIGRHDPAKRRQAAREKIESTAKSQSTKREPCGLHPFRCLPSNLCCRFCSSVAWLLISEGSLQVDNEERRDRLFSF